MHPPITHADLSTLIDEADAAARRLRRKLFLPAVDHDDLRQDLLVDLICRLPGFDARRGSIGAFANIVLRNHSSRIATRHHAFAEADVISALQTFDDVWGQLFPAEQTRIVQLLVRRVTVTSEGLVIDVRTDGVSGVMRDMMAPRKKVAAE